MSLYSIRDRAVDNFTAKNPNRIADPASISSFLEILMQLIAAFQDCRKEPEEAVRMVKNPTRWQRRVLNAKVRREVGRREYRRHGKDMVSALRETGRGTDVAEMSAAFDDVDD